MKPIGAKLWWGLIGLALIGVVGVLLLPKISRHRRFVARVREYEVLLARDGIIQVTGFIRDGMVMSLWAYTSGNTHENFGRLRVVYSGPYQPRNGRLSPPDLQDVITAVKALPTQSASPPPEKLVIVSYKEGVWKTRTYDRDALPPVVERIHELFERSFRSARTDSATNFSLHWTGSSRFSLVPMATSVAAAPGQ
jgi:hypothetical protein